MTNSILSLLPDGWDLDSIRWRDETKTFYAFVTRGGYGYKTQRSGQGATPEAATIAACAEAVKPVTKMELQARKMFAAAT